MVISWFVHRHSQVITVLGPQNGVVPIHILSVTPTGPRDIVGRQLDIGLHIEQAVLQDGVFRIVLEAYLQKLTDFPQVGERFRPGAGHYRGARNLGKPLSQGGVMLRQREDIPVAGPLPGIAVILVQRGHHVTGQDIRQLPLKGFLLTHQGINLAGIPVATGFFQRALVGYKLLGVPLVFQFEFKVGEGSDRPVIGALQFIALDFLNRQRRQGQAGLLPLHLKRRRGLLGQPLALQCIAWGYQVIVHHALRRIGARTKVAHIQCGQSVAIAGRRVLLGHQE